MPSLLLLNLFDQQTQQFFNKFDVLFVRTQFQNREMHKQTAYVLIMHGNIVGSLEVNVVTEVSSRVNAELALEILR